MNTLFFNKSKLYLYPMALCLLLGIQWPGVSEGLYAASLRCTPVTSHSFKHELSLLHPAPKALVFFSSWCYSCQKELQALASDPAQPVLLIQTFDTPDRNGHGVQDKADLSAIPCFFDTNRSVAQLYQVQETPHKMTLNTTP